MRERRRERIVEWFQDGMVDGIPVDCCVRDWANEADQSTAATRESVTHSLNCQQSRVVGRAERE